jgi:hypothetical protein
MPSRSVEQVMNPHALTSGRKQPSIRTMSSLHQVVVPEGVCEGDVIDEAEAEADAEKASRTCVKPADSVEQMLAQGGDVASGGQEWIDALQKVSRPRSLSPEKPRRGEHEEEKEVDLEKSRRHSFPKHKETTQNLRTAHVQPDASGSRIHVQDDPLQVERGVSGAKGDREARDALLDQLPVKVCGPDEEGRKSATQERDGNSLVPRASGEQSGRGARRDMEDVDERACVPTSEPVVQKPEGAVPPVSVVEEPAEAAGIGGEGGHHKVREESVNGDMPGSDGGGNGQRGEGNGLADKGAERQLTGAEEKVGVVEGAGDVGAGVGGGAGTGSMGYGRCVQGQRSPSPSHPVDLFTFCAVGLANIVGRQVGSLRASVYVCMSPTPHTPANPPAPSSLSLILRVPLALACRVCKVGFRRTLGFDEGASQKVQGVREAGPPWFRN